MPKNETMFQQDLGALVSMIGADEAEMKKVAEEMSPAAPKNRQEIMARYLRIRDNKDAWKGEIMERMRAIGPEKPMAMQRAIAQVQLYAQEGEKLLAKETE